MDYPAAAYGEIVERFGAALAVHCRGGILLVDECEPLDAEGAEMRSRN